MPARRLLAAAAAVAAALPATAALAAAPTRVARVSPFTRSGQVRPGLRVVTTKPGTCLPSSEAVPGAFRCFSDSNAVLDPCWKHGAHAVLCLPSPWARAATRMHVRGRLGRPAKGTAALPWGLRLRDGERCLLLQGASDVLRGRRINYACTRTRFLAGRPDRRRAVWRIRGARMTPAGHFVAAGTARIAIVYFGRP
ncbi:MAG TPA: hypothetical protein VH418_21710 [Solirubrobacteraceae bacterium]